MMMSHHATALVVVLCALTRSTTRGFFVPNGHSSPHHHLGVWTRRPSSIKAGGGPRVFSTTTTTTTMMSASSPATPKPGGGRRRPAGPITTPKTTTPGGTGASQAAPGRTIFFWDRKRVLRALTSLDRGEFRWELLTPWVTDRALTRLDKVFICLTFIFLAVALQGLLEPRTALPQHLSYVLNFFSYTIGNQVGYRLIAILASLLEIAAYDDGGGFVFAEDGIPDGYNALFIVVNLYYVMRWMLNRIDAIAGVLDPLEEELFSRCFEPLGVGPYQYLKLLDLAEFVRPTRRVALTVEGEPVEELFVSISGDFDVKTNGYRVASIPPFQIIGEVAALENLQSDQGDFHQAARATVLADPGSLYVKWRHEELFALQKSDAEFARAIRLAIARTLSHKLGSARRSAGKLVQLDTNKQLAGALQQQQQQSGDAVASSSSFAATAAPSLEPAESTTQTTPTRSGTSASSGRTTDARRRRNNRLLSEYDRTAEDDALRVLPVVAPEQERIYTACFLRRGFDDPQSFANLVRLAGPKRSTPATSFEGESNAAVPNNDRRVVRVSLDGGQRLFALSRGRAAVYDDAGVKVQSIRAPALVGVESFLESLIVFDGALGNRPASKRRVAASSSSDVAAVDGDDGATAPAAPLLLTVHVEPNSDFFLWNLRDVAPTVRTDPALRAALNRLYLSAIRDAPQKAAAIVAEQTLESPVVAISASSSSSSSNNNSTTTTTGAAPHVDAVAASVS